MYENHLEEYGTKKCHAATILPIIQAILNNIFAVFFISIPHNFVVCLVIKACVFRYFMWE